MYTTKLRLTNHNRGCPSQAWNCSVERKKKLTPMMKRFTIVSSGRSSPESSKSSATWRWATQMRKSISQWRRNRRSQRAIHQTITNSLWCPPAMNCNTSNHPKGTTSTKRWLNSVMTRVQERKKRWRMRIRSLMRRKRMMRKLRRKKISTSRLWFSLSMAINLLFHCHTTPLSRNLRRFASNNSWKRKRSILKSRR